MTPTAAQELRTWVGTAKSTTDPRWERRAAATGLVAAACMLGSYVALNLSSMPTSAARLATWYADGAHRAGLIASWYLVAFGSVFSIWFLATLRTVVHRAEGAEGRLAATAYGAGVVSVALFALGSVALTPIASELSFDKSHFAYDPALDHHLSMLAGAAAYAILATAGILAAVLLAAVAVATLRTELFPRWFGIASAFGALLLLATGFLNLLPVLLIPVWTIAASILTMRRVSRPTHIDVT